MNIILQHWTGEMDEIGRLSRDNIERYAAAVGADYRLLRGNVFRESLRPQHQKVFMLDECFDAYGVVVMLDMDMFAPKGHRHDIFAETGIGVGHPLAFRNMCSRGHPAASLASRAHPYWGGAIYRMGRAMRVAMRAGIDEDEMQMFNGPKPPRDEGIMHRLAIHADIRKDPYVFLDPEWALSSFLRPTVSTGFIHIRTRLVEGRTESAPKLSVYKRLVDEGILA